MPDVESSPLLVHSNVALQFRAVAIDFGQRAYARSKETYRC